MNSIKLVERLEHALEVTEGPTLPGASDSGRRDAADPEKRRKKLKLDLLIRKVLSRGIDPHWLLTGEGCMYQRESHNDPGKKARELRKMEHMLFNVCHRLRTVG